MQARRTCSILPQSDRIAGRRGRREPFRHDLNGALSVLFLVANANRQPRIPLRGNSTCLVSRLTGRVLDRFHASPVTAFERGRPAADASRGMSGEVVALELR